MYINTEAFVLKHYDLKESDKIITLYTRDLGKIQAVVKGIRKAKSKLAVTMEPFTYIDLTLYRKSQNKLFTITNGNIKYSLYKIKEDFLRIVYGDYLLELVDKLTETEEKNRALFNLIKEFLFLMEYKS
ncbi:DNA repair protein RecO, partial [bacterium]|nr:DNA repair protein RecO [bacterium]